MQKHDDDGIRFHGGISERSCLHRQHVGVARGGKQDSLAQGRSILASNTFSFES